MTLDDRLRILWFSGHTITATTRSGIQRVVLDAARAIKDVARLDVVKWDPLDGQLRYADAKEISTAFGGNGPSVNGMCHRRRYRFGDTIAPGETAWLVFPEIPSHLPDGNRVFARILSQCREYGVRTAVLYYDLVPTRVEEYHGLRELHEEYTRELLRADLIFPISEFTRNDLAHFLEKESGIRDSHVLEDARRKLIALPLAGNGPRNRSASSVPAPQKPAIILVGTVEPRKQQPRFLRIFNDARERHPALRDVKVRVFGSLHPASATAFQAELERNKNIEYLSFCSDEEIERAYGEAIFSVYPSRYEGFGLPILESMERGVPCLTANFGAMVEAAGDGGCLLVDINDDSEVERATVSLVTDAALRDSLRQQIKEKKFRTWGDYARDLIRHLSAWSAARHAAFESGHTRVQAWLRDPSPSAHDAFRFGDVSVVLENLGLEDRVSPADLASSDRRASVRITRMATGPTRNVPRGQLDIVVASDILLLPSQETLDAVVASANACGIDVPLPRHILVGREQHESVGGIAQTIIAHKSKQMEVEAAEQLLAQAYTRFRPARPAKDHELAVVISTYNRADFVAMNVDWLLGQISQERLPVVCVVVDNVSTDDTRLKLSRFLRNPHFRYVCNPQNVGMLGNLQVCSTLSLSRHVWITGDDDFIAPGALQRTLSVIRNHPSIPFIFHNFAVYHREKVSLTDSASRYVRSGTPVGTGCSDSGIYPVFKIAGEHDNLFTAIYPIVFRADIAAACFNYTFQGVPFSNLIESIPTTEIILGSYGSVHAQWFKEIGVVGNAHNSWAGHRPRWHLVLMAEALAMARDAGVNPNKVWKWLQVHRGLFKDAVDIAISKKATAHISPRDLEMAYAMFREPISLPQELRVSHDRF